MQSQQERVPINLDELNRRYGDACWHIEKAHTYWSEHGNLISEEEMCKAHKWLSDMYDVICAYGQQVENYQRWRFARDLLGHNATGVVIMLIHKLVCERHPLERMALAGADIDTTKYTAIRIVEFFKMAKADQPKYYRFRSGYEKGIRHSVDVCDCKYADNRKEWQKRAVALDAVLDIIQVSRLPTQVHSALPPPPPRTDGFQMSYRETVRRKVIAYYDKQQVDRAELAKRVERERQEFLDSLPDDDVRKRKAHKLAQRIAENKRARKGNVNKMMAHNESLRAALDINFSKPDMSGADPSMSGMHVLVAQQERMEEAEMAFNAEDHSLDMEVERESDKIDTPGQPRAQLDKPVAPEDD